MVLKKYYLPESPTSLLMWKEKKQKGQKNKVNDFLPHVPNWNGN